MNSKSYYGIMIHGGARTKRIKKSSNKSEKITRFLESSISNSFDLLKNGHNALEAVESAVVIMEDSGVFNAGLGSCLTIDKEVEMDASIMYGKDLAAGSVGMVNGITNPIKLARQVMEQTDHVLIVSDGAIKLARLINMDIKKNVPTEQMLRKFEVVKKKLEENWKKNSKLLKKVDSEDDCDTVGAISIDKEGNIASAVSTGGRWLKMHGRVGDSAVIGAGLYADNLTGAACATGYGEHMIRLCLSKYACDQMANYDALLASKISVDLLTTKFGENTGGIITVDSKGRFGAAHNTGSMPAAIVSNKDHKAYISLEANKIIPS